MKVIWDDGAPSNRLRVCRYPFSVALEISQSGRGNDWLETVEPRYVSLALFQLAILLDEERAMNEAECDEM